MDDRQRIDDILVTFDEMDFMPTTLLPDPEKARAEWRANLVAAIEEMDDKNASLAAKNEVLTRSCDDLVKTLEEERLEKFLADACLSVEEVFQYRKNLIYCKPLYGLHISALKIYDKPKELSEFISSKPKNKFRAHGDNLTRPPQSWICVEDKNE